MNSDLVLALYAVAAGAVFTATYALGHYHGRAYVSDRTFGPVAAGLVRIEAASAQLEVALDEPIPYVPVELADGLLTVSEARAIRDRRP